MYRSTDNNQNRARTNDEYLRRMRGDTNGANSDGTNSDGVNLNGENSNVGNSNGGNSNGGSSNGGNFNGGNSNGEYSNNIGAQELPRMGRVPNAGMPQYETRQGENIPNSGLYRFGTQQSERMPYAEIQQGQLRRNGMSQNNMWCGENGDKNCGMRNSLAMVYSPCQMWREIYEPDAGLERGTIFKELDKPFYGSRCGWEE